MDARRLRQIERAIERIKAQIGRIGVLRPGSLTRQYKDPSRQTGAYYQVSYTHRMRSHTAYVRARFAQEVRRQIRDYNTLKRLVERWVVLGIEHSQLSMRHKASQQEAANGAPRKAEKAARTTGHDRPRRHR